jgi:DNA-binding CsgD family transcriptional regulator
VRYDRQAKRLEPLFKDARLYAGLRVATKADGAVLSIAEGNRALARRLGIAERTVKAHLTSITRKLGLRNRMEATLLSVQWADELRPSGKSPERT